MQKIQECGRHRARNPIVFNTHPIYHKTTKETLRNLELRIADEFNIVSSEVDFKIGNRVKEDWIQRF